MMSKTMQDALNEQMKHEFYSHYLYLSMSAFCEGANLPGLARWMRAQAQEEAKHAMKVLRELLRASDLELKPVAAELVFDRSRIVFSYQCESRPDLTELQESLRRRLDRRVELRSVGPRECARLCGDHGLCGDEHCCRKFPSHEQPITLRMAKDQELPMSSGRITGLCGRLRCCLAFEHPTYKSFRDRAPRVGRRVETPHGGGVVTAYQVLADTCTVEPESGDSFDILIDDCREVA